MADNYIFNKILMNEWVNGFMIDYEYQRKKNEIYWLK
jgi:hypothetical protein